MPNTPDSATRARRLCEHMANSCVTLPGAINALSARLIEQHGFDALYLSGAVLANSVHGVPDTGLTTLSDVERHVRSIAAVTTLPIVADADTGFGGNENAARTVEVLEHAGASGIHLEDQEFPKRCGHLQGKTLVPAEDFAEKIAAAAAAKTAPEFLLIARTDARSVEGFDAAVDRARRYLAAGADAVFPEALRTRDEFETFARAVDAPLLANMTEFGKTPYFSVNDFAAMGFRLVIFPVTLQRAAMRAMERALATLRTDGSQAPLLDEMQTREELYELLDYEATV